MRQFGLASHSPIATDIIRPDPRLDAGMLAYIVDRERFYRLLHERNTSAAIIHREYFIHTYCTVVIRPRLALARLGIRPNESRRQRRVFSLYARCCVEDYTEW